MARALSLAADSTGKSSAAKIAMMAMTTKSSINVKAVERNGFCRNGPFIKAVWLLFDEMVSGEPFQNNPPIATRNKNLPTRRN